MNNLSDSFNTDKKSIRKSQKVIFSQKTCFHSEYPKYYQGPPKGKLGHRFIVEDMHGKQSGKRSPGQSMGVGGSQAPQWSRRWIFVWTFVAMACARNWIGLDWNTRKVKIQPDFNTAGTLDETSQNQISAGPKVFNTAKETRSHTWNLRGAVEELSRQFLRPSKNPLCAP